jgi:hypothetical protein
LLLCKTYSGNLTRRRNDQWNDFSPAPTVYLEVGAVNCDYRVLGMKFTEADQAQVSEIRPSVAVPLS